MPAPWEEYLERWTTAGLIEPSMAARLRTYEKEQQKAQGLAWPVRLALGFGGLLLAAGVLLFVAAHWDTLSPAQRFSLVLALVASFHVSGAFVAERFPALASTLHAVGTVCLGAGIFLVGQIFHLQEHWPTGLLLWALGAWIAWALLRDWPQATLVAMLTPLWLSGEWIEATRGWTGASRILAEGALLLYVTYLTALMPQRQTPVRKALMWIGGLSLIPSTFGVIFSSTMAGQFSALPLPGTYQFVGWTLALGLPLALAWWLRGTSAWMNLVAALWVVMLGTVAARSSALDTSVWHYVWYQLGPYWMCAVASVGLIAWGLKESRKERINLGVAGFALTIMFFYFSTVMDKLGRSASLIGLGLLFLLGGWLMERTRRRLVAWIDTSQ